MCMRQREVVDITILACGSAISEKLRCTLCTNERTWLLTLKVAPRIHGTPCRTRGGWRVPTLLNGTFHGVFIPAVEDIRHTGPVVLFLDGHRSHTTLGLVEEVRVRGIVFYTFPPHTTHLLQPLDVGVFGPLKHVWSKILKEFKMETMAAKVD